MRFKIICERCKEQIEVGEMFVEHEGIMLHSECAIDWIECNERELEDGDVV